MKIKLFLTAILMIPLLLWGQCEVFIEPGSVVVTDNGSGVKFEFDITNNSSTEWFGDDLKLAWTLNSGAPIWNIDYTQNTNAGPIIPGETRNIKTPWFDIPNLPSWYPIPPVTYGDPWVESLEWPYWSANPDGFDGNWSPFNLRLGSCGMADGTWVYDGGELYYGPTNTDCPDVNNDAFCDCDVDFVDFNPITYDVSIVIISQQNCGQSLNNGPTSNMDDIGMLQIATHVPGWDFDWGCVSADYHLGWTFDNPLSGFALNSYSNGDTINYNLFSDDSIYDDCFQELLESDTLSECLEIVLWQINYSQTLLVEDGGWASTCGTCGNQTQEYPDINVEGNSINVCDFLPAPPDLIGVSVNITDQYCSLIGDIPTYQIQVTLTNIGMGDVASFCLLPEIGNNTFCFNGEINPGVYIEPGDTITIMGDVQVPNGWVDGEDNSITILSVPNETLISNNNFSFSMGESLECGDPEPCDTIYVEIIDTLYIDNFITDTLYIDNFITDTLYVDVLDTIEVEIPIYITDTITVVETETIFITDTIINTEYIYITDTLYTTVTDTIIEYQFIEIDCASGLPCDEIDDCNPLVVYIPNTFTPNNDGINDAWEVILDPECWTGVEVRVFNRWGVSIWEMYDPYYLIWDGSNMGGNFYVPDGVYFWTFTGRKLNTTVIEELTGTVTIFR